MKTLIILLYFTLSANSQTNEIKFIKTINKTIDSLENEIITKQNIINSQEIIIQEYIEKEINNQNIVQKAIQKRKFEEEHVYRLNRQLKDNLNRMDSFIKRNKQLENNNKNLSKKITYLKTKMQEDKNRFLKQTIEFKKQFEENKESKLYDLAEKKGKSDFLKGKTDTSLSFFQKNKPIIFFNTGYRAIQGVHFDLNFGSVIGSDDHIYLGMGLNWSAYYKYNSPRSGINVTTRIGLNESITQDEESAYYYEPCIYFIGEFGHIWYNKSDENFKGGFTINTGLGVLWRPSKTVFIDSAVTWRRIGGKKNINGNFIKQPMYSIDLRLGVGVYIGR